MTQIKTVSSNCPKWRNSFLFGLLLLIVSISYFWNLGAGSLREWDEALSAERSREILETGQWLTPQFGYEPDFNKPPLYYWLTAINYKILGINEFSVRLWSVLFGLACITLIFLIARNLTRSPSAGLIAAFILATNPHWINMTREGLLDSGMLFGMLSCIYLLNRAAGNMAWASRPYSPSNPCGENVAWASCPCASSQPGSEQDTPGMHGPDARALFSSSHALKTRAIYALAGLCLAIGILIKGPLPFFVFAVPLWDRFISKTRKHSLPNLAITLAVSISLAAPWFLYQNITYGEAFYKRYISRNLLDRFTQTIESHHGSAFFYLNHWMELAPLSLILFLAALLIGAISHRRALKYLSSMAILALLFLIFLSIASSKRDLYLLLIYPFAAIASGGIFANFLQTLRVSWLKKTLAYTLVILGLYGFYSSYDGSPDHGHWLKQTGLKIADIAPGEEMVWSVNIPLNNLLFYAQRNVRHIPMEKIPESSDTFSRAKGNKLFFVVLNKELDEFLNQAQSLPDNFRTPGKIIYQNRKHTILAFQKK